MKAATVDSTIEWLLEGDPSVRCHTLRDLVGAADAVVATERAKIAREGWGARLLGEQGADGRFAGGKSADGGLYVPKWTSTTYTMLALRDFGLDPADAQAKRACKLLLDEGLRQDGGVGYGARFAQARRGETCVTGMVLSILSYFGYDDARVDAIAAHLLEEQMPDGGWNCRRFRGDTHSSVHTTISVLEGLRMYERRARKLRVVKAAQRRGREFLLVHRLFRSHRTGAIIKPELLRFVFPPRWHYDVLRALDHFQSVQDPRDERLVEALELVRERRGADGRWALQHRYAGKTYFDLERIGAPSRWNTLRALRVLRWWDE